MSDNNVTFPMLLFVQPFRWVLWYPILGVLGALWFSSVFDGEDGVREPRVVVEDLGVPYLGDFVFHVSVHRDGRIYRGAGTCRAFYPGIDWDVAADRRRLKGLDEWGILRVADYYEHWASVSAWAVRFRCETEEGWVGERKVEFEWRDKGSVRPRYIIPVKVSVS